MPPNLFDYATKELSQDAVICWLIKWSVDDSDPDLQALGRRFVNALLNHEPGNPVLDREVRRVDLWQQEKKIDILARINGRHVLLIEDKKDAPLHGDQLAKYRRLVLDTKTALGQVAEENLFSILLKTSNYTRKIEREIEAESYRVFNRADFMNVLATYNGNSDIVSDLRCTLASVETQTQSFRTWGPNTRQRRREAWQGLYRELEAMFMWMDVWNGWGYVPLGDFWGFWWAPQGLPDGCPVYIQLEEEKLTVKIEVPRDNQAPKKQLREYWCARVTTDSPIFIRPPYPREGEHMTVAVSRDGWLRFGKGGSLSLHDTVEFLRKVEHELERKLWDQWSASLVRYPR